nr:uncharacterized protein LOC111423130 [Onthophagus taurus]
MRSVLLVISLLFVSGGCYHLLIVENLRIEFLKLHSEIVKNVSNNDTLRHDITLILHDYKPFLIRLKKVEQDVLNYDFIINSNKFNNNIRNHFESIYNTTININSKKRYNENNFKDGIKRFNYTRILQDFRNKTNKQTYFYSFLEKIDKTTLEQYSKHELCFILYQYLTLTDIKGLILTSLFEFTTNNSSIPLKLPPVAKYNNILLSLGNIPDDIWRQDPANHKKGKTYIEIEKFLQAVIVYEKHMYPFNCKNECIDYKNVTSIKNDCGQQFNEMAFNCKSIVDTYHRTQLLNCHEVSPTLTTCRDTFPRIYKYSKFGNQIYGDNSGCTQKEQTFTTNKGCSYCVCTMYYKRYSAKYISLRSVTSTIDKNRYILDIYVLMMPFKIEALLIEKTSAKLLVNQMYT